MDVKRSETISSLAGALAKAQGEFTAARFDAVNPFLKNKYASLGSIIEAAKPIMAKNGLSVTQPVIGDGATIGVTTILLHSSGEWIESTMSLPIVEERGKSQAQAAGSVITYLRRYALASVLGMYAEADTDEAREPGKSEQKAAPPKQEPKADSHFEQGSLMTLEMAMSEASSDGTLYGKMADSDLTNRLNGIRKGLEKKDIAPDYREELLRKQDAIKVILADRAKAA